MGRPKKNLAATAADVSRETINKEKVANVECPECNKEKESESVEKAFNVLTTKAKCFEYWQDKKTEVARNLQIRPIEKEQFKLDFSSAFDLFKSIKEAEHKKILNFVKENVNSLTTFSEGENVSELYVLFKKSERTNFNDLQLKAILFAALFEVLNIKENKNEK